MMILQGMFLYLDPGTGSLIVQFLIAAVFGIILSLKQVKIKIRYVINRIFKTESKSENET